MDFLRTIVWVGIVSTIVIIALTVFSIWWMVRSQRRRNRFGRDDRIVAPTHWLYTPGESPRLHRRLLSACAAARQAARVIDGRRLTPSGAVDVADELERQAGVVDDGLILAGRLDSRRRQTLLESLRPQVVEIEAVAERLVRLAADGDHGRLALDVGRLNERLDALEQAGSEVAELEAAFRR